jgi:hypothetical protein
MDETEAPSAMKYRATTKVMKRGDKNCSGEQMVLKRGQEKCFSKHVVKE